MHNWSFLDGMGGMRCRLWVHEIENSFSRSQVDTPFQNCFVCFGDVCLFLDHVGADAGKGETVSVQIGSNHRSRSADEPTRKEFSLELAARYPDLISAEKKQTLIEMVRQHQLPDGGHAR